MGTMPRSNKTGFYTKSLVRSDGILLAECMLRVASAEVLLSMYGVCSFWIAAVK